MKLKSKLKYIVSMTTAASIAVFLSACGGGSGDNTSAISGQNNAELAQQFVNSLNASGEYDVTLAKANTLQPGFIVIYDRVLRDYNAVDISKYAAGMNAGQYLNHATVFWDLLHLSGTYQETYIHDSVGSIWVPGDYYWDSYTNTTFEIQPATSKDIELYRALAEEVVFKSRAEQMSEQLGLSVERSYEIVRIADTWKKAGGKDITDADHDAFSQELLGFSITELKNVLSRNQKRGSEAIQDLINRAADANDITPEAVGQILKKFNVEI